MSRLYAQRPGMPTLMLHSDPQEPIPASQGWSFYTVADADFGHGDAQTQAIDEMLGSLVEVSRYSNRQVTFTVTCAAAEGESLAQGEAALAAMLADRFELVWEPIAAFSQPVSFWIEPGAQWPRVDEPQGLEWSLAEVLYARRSWSLTLTARPFVLAASETVTSWALSGNQGTHTVAVGGTAPANASLTIDGGSTGLGSVVAHVAQTSLAYNPALRARMTSGTADLARTGVAAFAGTTWKQLNGFTFAVPLNTLPEGPYELLAHLHSQTANLTTDIVWHAQVRDGAANIGPQITGSVWATFDADKMLALGGLTLPIQGVDTETAVVQVDFACANDLYIDEGWLLWITDGDAALLRGELGTGTPTIGTVYSRLEVQGPQVTEPKQRLKVGLGGVATVSGGSVLPVRDRIVVKPGPVQVYAACSGVSGATVSFGPREAFHHHVAGSAS